MGIVSYSKEKVFVLFLYPFMCLCVEFREIKNCPFVYKGNSKHYILILNEVLFDFFIFTFKQLIGFNRLLYEAFGSQNPEIQLTLWVFCIDCFFIPPTNFLLAKILCIKSCGIVGWFLSLNKLYFSLHISKLFRGMSLCQNQNVSELVLNWV